MSKLKYTKKDLCAYLSILLVPSFGLIFTYLQYKSNKEVEPVLSTEEFNIQEKIKLENEYQLKITRFNPDQYDLPSTNLANRIEINKCINGFGGEMSKIHHGMFSEPLYALDAEKIETNLSGEFAYSPYVKSYNVVGDILFQKPLDLFDRKLITFESLGRNFSDIRTIVGTREYKNSFSTMESKFGFPQSYLVQQSGGVADFSTFNNQCEKKIGRKNVTFKKVNLSNLPISFLLAANYQTTLQHGVNGLYNHTSKNTYHVSGNFLEWVQSNNRAYQYILNNNDFKFKEGSYIYLPIKYQNFSDLVRVDFKSPPIGKTLEEIKREVSEKKMIPLDHIYIVEEKLSDYSVIKFTEEKSLEPIDNLAFALRDGEIYQATWEQPGEIQIESPHFASGLVLMNNEALFSALTVFKGVYQGMSLDLNTDNFKLNIEDAKANSKASTESFNEKLNKIESLLKVDN